MKKYTLIALATIVTISVGGYATEASTTLQELYAKSTTYSVSMDYSKTSEQLMTALGITPSQRDENISLGILNQAPNVGTGQKILTMKCVPQGDFLPSTSWAGTVMPAGSGSQARLTMEQYYSYMHTRGYRPPTINELLTAVAQNQSMINCVNIAQGFANANDALTLSALGSAFELPDFLTKTTTQTSSGITATIPYGAKIIIPTISSSGGAYSIKLTAPQVTTYGTDVNKMSFSLAMGKIVVVDPNASTASTNKISSLPTQNASQTQGSSQDRYVRLSGESYPVTVNYDSPQGNSLIRAHDIPNTYSPGNYDDSKYSGTHNINIVFAVIRNSSLSVSFNSAYNQASLTNPWIAASNEGMDASNSNSARGLLIKWMSLPENSGYRFATARELAALNDQYTNQLPYVAALGSFNDVCTGWPLLFPVSASFFGNQIYRTPVTNYSAYGKKVSYMDLKWLDRRPCYGGGYSSLDNPLSNYQSSKCQYENTYNINEVRFALVPKSSYNPAGY